MQLDLNYRNLEKESHASTRQALSDLVKRHLEPHVSAFNPHQLRLHATFEENKHDYKVTLRLLLPPRKLLVAKAEDDGVFQDSCHL